MDKMPEHKENHITLWRDGKWVQVHLAEMSKIMEEDNRPPEPTGEEIGTQNSADLPAGA